MTTPTRPGHPTPTGSRTHDTGSVTPLIIGMTLCLLLLGAGITATGSAFLAGQRLQHLCDGAASTAAGTLTDNTTTNHDAITAANDYLATRTNQAQLANATLQGTTLTLTCTTTTPITFGALFDHPTLNRTTTSTAHTNYHTG